MALSGHCLYGGRRLNAGVVVNWALAYAPASLTKINVNINLLI
jgi:hypothetical protein